MRTINKQLAKRIISENPAFVSPDDQEPVEFAAQMVVDRMHDEAISFPEGSQEREQLLKRIDGYGNASKTKTEIRGHVEGRLAYMKGQSIEDNPYDAAAYPYTDEGLARDGWLEGFQFEWHADGCPADRWPEASNTVAALERRASRPKM